MQGNEKQSALAQLRPLIVAGVTIILVFFVGLGSWAAVAPLQSAAIAPGVLNVESNRKTIQHLEGGIVAELLVSEGQQVLAGQTLLRLDATQSGASVAQLKNRYVSLKAQEARLIAERDGNETIVFSAFKRVSQCGETQNRGNRGIRSAEAGLEG